MDTGHRTGLGLVSLILAVLAALVVQPRPSVAARQPAQLGVHPPGPRAGLHLSPCHASAAVKCIGRVSVLRRTVELTQGEMTQISLKSSHRPLDAQAKTMVLSFRRSLGAIRSIRAGTVLVFPISSVTPRGMIRRVLSVHRERIAVGQVRTTVVTVPAALSDALGPQDITFYQPHIAHAPYYVSDKEVGSINENFDVGAGVTASASVNVDVKNVFLKIPSNHKSMFFSAEPTETATLGLQFGKGQGSAIEPPALPVGSFAFVVAGIPIVLSADIEASLSYNAQASIGASVVQSAEGSFCVQYSNKKWTSKIGRECEFQTNNTDYAGSSFTNDVHVDPPALSTSGDFDVKVGPHVSLTIGGAVGPEVGLEAEGVFHADTQGWSFHRQLSLPAELRATIVGHKFKLWSGTLKTFNIGQDESGSFAQPPTATPQPTTTTVPPVNVVPGGTWISPAANQSLQGTVNFSAHAYPTHPGDPAIDHVNFTVGWPATAPTTWEIACTAYPPSSGDVFSCSRDLSQLGVPSGPLLISFDVYDQANNYNLSPNGERTIDYEEPCGQTLGQHCTAVWTNRSQYTIGDSIQVCYSVPFAAHIRLTDIEADGTPQTWEGDDDGTGGCLVGTVTPPTGTEHFRIDVYQGTAVYQSAETSFQVLPAVTHPVTSSYEAESPSNGIDGAARVLGCTSCSNGARVGWIGNFPTLGWGTLSFTNVMVSQTATSPVTIYYVNGDSSDRYVCVEPNPAVATVAFGGTVPTFVMYGPCDPTAPSSAISVTFPSTGSWDTVGSVTVNVPLRAGANSLLFYNAAGSGPDIDRIVVQGSGGSSGGGGTPSCGTTRGQQCTAIWTDSSQYYVGSQITICYSVSHAGPFQIVDYPPGQSSQVIIRNVDDGTGDCFAATATTPTGTERVEIDELDSSGNVTERAQTSFQVYQTT